MTDNDNILTEPQMHRVYDVARRVNVLIEAVEALRRQVEQHIAAADGADPVEGKDVCPKCGGSGMIYCGWGEAEYCECRRDWKKEYEDAEEAIGGLVDERDELRAERDALQAKVNKHEKEMIDYIDAVGELERRQTARLRAEVEEHRRHVATVMQREAALKREVERLRRDAVDGEVLDEYEEVTVPELEHERDQLRTERDAAQARVAELEPNAALGALVRRVVETHKTVEIVRSSTGYHDVLLNGHIDVHGKRHAIHGGGRKLDDALRAALGEGREEGE
jgi:regulator of replication initiation timing